MGNFKEDIAKVKAFVFDVDGVLTDGLISVTPDRDFIRSYNAKDGYVLSYALKRGYQIIIITGGRGASLHVRFEMLGIKHVYTNCFAKMEALTEVMSKLDLKAEEMLYMGDDIPDIEPMCHVGVSACPADASIDVLKIARYVSQFKGGEGCVRDVMEQVLRARGDWYTPGDKESVLIASR